MKVLKIIGVVVLSLVVLVVVLGLVAPKKYEVTRSTVINAPQDLVFRQVQFWNNWQAWSPWAEHDSTMTVAIEGVDGQVGAKYKWVGDPEITGTGEMTNTGVKPNEEMMFHLHFITPMEGESDGYMRLAAGANGGTEATWGFGGSNPFPFNIVMLFMSMDKMMGPDFERGLELLKQVTEAKASKLVNLRVEQIELKATSYAAIRQDAVKMSELKSFFESSYATIQSTLAKSKATMTGPPVGLYYSWDEANGVTDMAAAIPVRGNVAAGNVQMISVPAGKALVVNYYGPYEQIELAHIALMNYVQNNSLNMGGPVVEEYVTDPGSEPDQDKWLTRVIYPIL